MKWLPWVSRARYNAVLEELDAAAREIGVRDMKVGVYKERADEARREWQRAQDRVRELEQMNMDMVTRGISAATVSKGNFEQAKLALDSKNRPPRDPEAAERAHLESLEYRLDCVFGTGITDEELARLHQEE